MPMCPKCGEEINGLSVLEICRREVWRARDFYWSGYPRDHPEAIGEFYSPETIFRGLAECASKHGFGQLRKTIISPSCTLVNVFSGFWNSERLNFPNYAPIFLV